MAIVAFKRGFGFFRSLQVLDLVGGPRDGGYRRKVADIRAASAPDALLSGIARALEAPDGYLAHTNLDLLEEIVSDLGWMPFDRLALVLIGSAAQWRTQYAAMSTVLEICADASTLWQSEGKGFFTAFVD